PIAGRSHLHRKPEDTDLLTASRRGKARQPSLVQHRQQPAELFFKSSGRWFVPMTRLREGTAPDTLSLGPIQLVEKFDEALHQVAFGKHDVHGKHDAEPLDELIDASPHLLGMGLD